MTITARIDRITDMRDRAAAVLPAPRSVKIEITSRCNFNCSFCAHAMGLRKEGEMDRRLFERLLLEMREFGVEEIGLFYLGESLTCPWLDQAVQFAKHEAKFPYVFLTTNGSLAKPPRVSKLMRNGLDSLKFSLNWADEQQFVEVAKAQPQLFDLTIRNIKAARKIRDTAGYKTGLYASYIDYDGEQRDRMQAVIREVGPYLDEVYALPLYSQAELTGKEERDKGWKVTAGNRGRVGALRDPIPCWSVFTEGHISWDGKLVACCFSHQGFDMGDLTKLSFMDAWNSDKFQELRKAHLAKEVVGTECEQCVAYR